MSAFDDGEHIERQAMQASDASGDERHCDAADECRDECRVNTDINDRNDMKCKRVRISDTLGRNLNDSVIASLNYLPKFFLRCHCKDNDPFDNETAIWSAAFQPKSKLTNGSEFVATCGANIICIIDVRNDKSIGSHKAVVARYIDDDRNEEFASIAWNVMPSDANLGDGDVETVLLAVGGRKQILLMSTEELVCYERITEAHTDHINALLFHQNNPFWLFSASYDMHIKLWEIVGPNSSNKAKLLKVFDTRTRLLSLCHSLEFNTIIASGLEGVVFWYDLSLEEHKPNGVIRTKSLVDGLCLIPDDPNCLAMRVSNSKYITIIDLKKVIEYLQKSTSVNKFRNILLAKVQKIRLQWYSNTEYPFIYMSAQRGLLVSGAPNGQMWVYNTNKFKDYNQSNELVKPDKIVSWPAIEKEIRNDRYVIDENKFVIINAVAISPDLNYLVGCTNLNLVCIWYLS